MSSNNSPLVLKIFVSSPGDVASERAIAEASIERLQIEFKGRALLKPYLWERTFVRATEGFQPQITDIQKVDLAIFILWSRLGTPLPERVYFREDGTSYRSGTEYEFEQAREGFAKNGNPDILCYLKTADVTFSVGDVVRRSKQIAQLDAVTEFKNKWFGNNGGAPKGALREFDQPSEFEELLETHLRAWIHDRLKKNPTSGTQGQALPGSPFRGLEKFEFEHALIYFGRTRMVSEVLGVLRDRGKANRGFMMITGMSGVGKSSLIRAGVLPLMARPRVVERTLAWRRLVYVANKREGLLRGFVSALVTQALPELALVAAALPELKDDPTPVDTLFNRPVELSLALCSSLDKATLQQHERVPQLDPHAVMKLVVVVDQFEEIFDETVTKEERKEFVEILRSMVVTGRIWVICALRADLFSRCSELPESFRDLYIEKGGLFTVGGPRPPEIAQMIRRPALMAGLEFEKDSETEEGLDDVLRDAASGNPGVLPLLEFALDELWRRSRLAKSNVLRFSDYRAFGELYGALRVRATEEFERLPQAVQRTLPAVLGALVHIDVANDQLVLQHRAPLKHFAAIPHCAALVEAFVSARLLVADKASDDTPVIALAHEALLREWPPAVDWIEANRTLLRQRAEIVSAEALYKSSGRKKSRLLTGESLKVAKRLLKSQPDMLEAAQKIYVRGSLAEHRKRLVRQTIQGFGAAAVVALFAIGSVLGVEQLMHRASMVVTLPRAYQNHPVLPLSAASLANLQSSIKSLSSYLEARAKEMGSSNELTPWTIAEMALALHDADAAAPAISPRELRSFMSDRSDKGCSCWRETEDKLPHSVATAWVLHALAKYKQPATSDEIKSVFDRQHAEGWWSMFPSTSEAKNASVSATALTTLALITQAKNGLLVAQQSNEVNEKIQRGRRWLLSNTIRGRARWREYPTGTAERREYLAVSALAIHVLRQTGDSEFDRGWLSALPWDIPAILQNEQAKGHVHRTARTFTTDDTRHYIYPWVLRTTVEASNSGNLWERARAIAWIERALDRTLEPKDFTHESGLVEDWTMAEVLFALREIRSLIVNKEAKSN